MFHFLKTDIFKIFMKPSYFVFSCLCYWTKTFQQILYLWAFSFLLERMPDIVFTSQLFFIQPSLGESCWMQCWRHDALARFAAIYNKPHMLDWSSTMEKRRHFRLLNPYANSSKISLYLQIITLKGSFVNEYIPPIHGRMVQELDIFAASLWRKVKPFLHENPQRTGNKLSDC